MPAVHTGDDRLRQVDDARIGQVPGAVFEESRRLPPLEHVAAPVAAGQPPYPARTQQDPASGVREFPRDLHARLCRTHNQHRALGQRLGPLVLRRVQVEHGPRYLPDDRGELRVPLETAGHDERRRPVGGVGGIDGVGMAFPARGDRWGVLAHGQSCRSRVAGQRLGELCRRGELVGRAGQWLSGQRVGPVRRDHAEPGPPPRAPRVPDAAPLKDDVRHTARGQLLAHRDARLPAADNDHVHPVLLTCDHLSVSAIRDRSQYRNWTSGPAPTPPG